jgi:hypothetical protein
MGAADSADRGIILWYDTPGAPGGILECSLANEVVFAI